MNGTTEITFQKTIGDTLYIVDTEYSETARETPYEKIKKLILNDTDSTNKEQLAG